MATKGKSYEACLLEKVLEQIKVKRTFSRTFKELTDGFEKKLADFNPSDNYVEVKDYFSEGYGEVKAKGKLLADGKIKDSWLKDKKDFSGLYVFLNGKTPFYVGISKGVIGRIVQHVKGYDHHTSTLAYNLGKIVYEICNGEVYAGTRDGFDFQTYGKPMKDFLFNQRVAFFPISTDDDYYEELALFEIFCSMELKTILNKFETH